MKLGLGIGLIMVLIFSCGVYAMIEAIPLEELVGQSEIIAVATLKIVNKHAQDADGWVRIDNTLVFEDVLKGKVGKGDEVVIETLDGLEDMPVLTPQAKFLIFLQKMPNSHKFMTTNMIQGCWQLDEKGQPMGMGLGVDRKKIEELIKNPPAPADKTAPTPMF